MEFKFDSSTRCGLTAFNFYGDIPTHAHVSGIGIQIERADPIVAREQDPDTECVSVEVGVRLGGEKFKAGPRFRRDTRVTRLRRSFCSAAHLCSGLTPSQFQFDSEIVSGRERMNFLRLAISSCFNFRISQDARLSASVNFGSARPLGYSSARSSAVGQQNSGER